jgi:hypothetical protein
LWACRHFDHLGGLIIDAEKPDLQFPNAKVHMARAEYDFWTQKDLVLNAATGGDPTVGVGIVDAAQTVLSKVRPDPHPGHRCRKSVPRALAPVPLVTPGHIR